MRRAVLAVAIIQTASIAQVSPAEVMIDWATVGDPGNVADAQVMNDGTTGYGSVPYTYRIGKYEVTIGQYIDFLNAVASLSDPVGLYNPMMGYCIQRTGSADSYLYGPAGGDPVWLNKPVGWVSYFDALRFANWLHNDQPRGAQDAGTTEDGAYTFTDPFSAGSRNPGARVFLPAEDEWYKAAYYKGHGADAGYWDYATQSDTPPTRELPPGTDMVNGSANYDQLPPPYQETDVGAYTAKPSVSAYGTYDQGGNLWEWNEDAPDYDPLSRIMRGGSFQTPTNEIRASWRDNVGAVAEAGTLGFRLASIPEPNTMILLSMGLLSFLASAWRKRRAR